MYSYLKEAVEEFGEPMDPAVTPERSDIFAVDHARPLADEKRKKLFHRLVHELLYCSCMGRNKRVKNCNQED